MAVVFSCKWIVSKAEYSVWSHWHVEGTKLEQSTSGVLHEVSVFQLSNFSQREMLLSNVKVILFMEKVLAALIDHSRFLMSFQK